MRRIKRDDSVVVIAGDHKGEKGKVLSVDLDANRILIEGVNLVYKHVKRSQQFPQGGRIEREAPVHASNVMLFDEKEGRPVRVKAGKDDSGNKIRVSTRTNNPL
mgnify:CR=1 FL=1